MNKENLKSTLKKYRIDIIVIASILVLSLICFLFLAIFRKPGAYAVIKHDEKVIAKYPLELDGVYSLNGGTNTLTIKGGVAYITASTCPTHSCEKYKAQWIGQNIVCQPNDVTVSIQGVSDDALDFVPGA